MSFTKQKLNKPVDELACNLYVIRCWTNAAGATTVWHGNASTPGIQSELRCSVLAVVSDGAGRCATRTALQ